MNEVLLSVENINAHYGAIHVLHDISLQVRAREIVSLIGSNGAGKTSILRCLSGIHPLSCGKITFAGTTISALPAHRIVAHGLAQVPEGRLIFPRLTVMENLRLGAFLVNDQKIIADGIEHAFHLFPVLAERRHQTGGTLSGGEQQMLAISRALMSRPRLLLMDEPSMGVAPLLTAKIFAAITELNKEGLAVLLVEQNAHLALSLAHRGYVLETGKIVAHDDAKKLLHDPQVKQAYLGE
jgi:branched-chain amino acid transport system ATP-binding protein